MIRGFEDIDEANDMRMLDAAKDVYLGEEIRFQLALEL